MPYTLAHPAAIIPLSRLLRGRAPLSALVIGSMAPDFPYFVGGVSGEFSHSLAGLLLYCVPAGLVAYLVFHGLLKQPSIALLPHPIAARLAPGDAGRPQASYAAVSVSLALGALTHLVWDGFTHADTAFVEHLAILGAVVGVAGHHEVRLFEALQYVCSVLGLGAIALWVLRWMRRTPPRAAEPPSLPLRARCALFAVMGAGALAAGLATGLRSFEASEAFLVALIVNSMNGCAAVWAAYCLAWRFAAIDPARWRSAGLRRWAFLVPRARRRPRAVASTSSPR